ncbi:MAG: hypothetical protein AAF215_33005 [Cyanobacteria bacterium P01_A01_bin.123]
MNGWMITIVLAIFGVFALIGAYRSRQRTKAIKAIADQLGFSVIGNDNLKIPPWAWHLLGNNNLKIPALAWHLDLFSKGRSRRVQNLIQGQQRNVQVSIFDYAYRVGSGKRANAHRQTVVLLNDPDIILPRFVLMPETIFHRLGGLFGYADIDFNDYPEFSRRYLLRGEEETEIRRLFNDRVIPFYQNRPGVNTEGSGNFMVYYYFHRLCPPQEWRAFLQEAMDAYALFKDAAG